jgi:hypothetical protein
VTQGSERPDIEELHAAHNAKLQEHVRQSNEERDSLKRELKAAHDKLAAASAPADA